MRASLTIASAGMPWHGKHSLLWPLSNNSTSSSSSQSISLLLVVRTRQSWARRPRENCSMLKKNTTHFICFIHKPGKSTEKQGIIENGGGKKTLTSKIWYYGGFTKGGLRVTLHGTWIAGVSSLKSCRSVLKTSYLISFQPLGKRMYQSEYFKKKEPEAMSVTDKLFLFNLSHFQTFSVSCFPGESIPWICETFHLANKVPKSVKN